MCEISKDNQTTLSNMSKEELESMIDEVKMRIPLKL